MALSKRGWPQCTPVVYKILKKNTEKLLNKIAHKTTHPLTV